MPAPPASPPSRTPAQHEAGGSTAASGGTVAPSGGSESLSPSASSHRSNSSSGNNGGGHHASRQHFSSNGGYFPASDAQTYRDLLIFEERLKQNAARLIKRKKKYQTFLVLLCAAIAVSGYYVFVLPAVWLPLHYLNVTVFLITATMLLLFFASGMYAERITAANKFVPQANRSLRSYNMYLNTRTAQGRSIFSIFSPPTPSQPLPRSPLYLPGEKDGNSNGGTTRLVRTSSASGGPGVARRLAIPTIPPSSNPRGELIFGSKVSPTFREGYERYRAAFERRRREKLEERHTGSWRGWRLFGGHRATARSSDASTHMEKGHAAPHSQHIRASSSTVGAGDLPSGNPRLSPRQQRGRLHESNETPAGGVLTGGGESESSSRASSRRSTPTTSPKLSSRRARAGSGRSGNDLARAGSRRHEVQAPSEEKQQIMSLNADTSDPMDGNGSGKEVEPRREAHGAGSSPGASLPDVTTVASRADDRSAPEATLREPDSDGD